VALSVFLRKAALANTKKDKMAMKTARIGVMDIGQNPCN